MMKFQTLSAFLAFFWLASLSSLSVAAARHDEKEMEKHKLAGTTNINMDHLVLRRSSVDTGVHWSAAAAAAATRDLLGDLDDEDDDNDDDYKHGKSAGSEEFRRNRRKRQKPPRPQNAWLGQWQQGWFFFFVQRWKGCW
jgi:hypothetical protein